MAQPATYALSIKQPWAALVVHGLKTIEVRRWSTTRQGRIFIHAASIPDDRPEAWRHVAEAVRDAASLRGGIIGAADLIGCQTYRNVDDFLKDQNGHLNESSWFRKPVLYGFTFRNPETFPFQAYPGWMRFFSVNDGLVLSQKRK